jgi:hypothetical protein
VADESDGRGIFYDQWIFGFSRTQDAGCWRRRDTDGTLDCKDTTLRIETSGFAFNYNDRGLQFTLGVVLLAFFCAARPNL